jgi:hypothetical protein
MDQKRLVCEGRGLSKVKYAVQNSKESFLTRDEGVFIAHTSKTSRWKDSAYLTVRQDFLRISTDSNLETTQKSLWTKEKNSGAHSEFLDNILIRIMNLSRVATID